ncbi:MAG TPA: hypothetical protein VME63_05320 [Dyella sp.]|uniref:hypothetical protein n=1 Tax=Dyella sp. TaxID=1869338 RepID=UPI002BBEC777|nr:hypothetical protein [Dyella sp.]HTV84801.1 hypothetical protein [Dyella sp.]
MEGMHEKSNGEQFYVLTKRDYDELRDIQTQLVVMAQVSYSDEDIEESHLRRMLNRCDINRFFAQISAQIGKALDGIRKDNSVGAQRQM